MITLLLLLLLIGSTEFLFIVCSLFFPREEEDDFLIQTIIMPTEPRSSRTLLATSTPQPHDKKLDSISLTRFDEDRLFFADEGDQTTKGS